MLYWPIPNERAVIVQHDTKQPLKCDVCHVWGEDLVNVLVTDSNGRQHVRTSITVVQEGGPYRAEDIAGQPYVTWMAYQVGQAAKYEKLEQKIASSASEAANRVEALR
jgi:hypothetical protein